MGLDSGLCRDGTPQKTPVRESTSQHFNQQQVEYRWSEYRIRLEYECVSGCVCGLKEKKKDNNLTLVYKNNKGNTKQY